MSPILLKGNYIYKEIFLTICSGFSFSKEELKELMENMIESTRKYSVDNINELRLSLDGYI